MYIVALITLGQDTSSCLLHQQFCPVCVCWYPWTFFLGWFPA